MNGHDQRGPSRASLHGLRSEVTYTHCYYLVEFRRKPAVITKTTTLKNETGGGRFSLALSGLSIQPPPTLKKPRTPRKTASAAALAARRNAFFSQTELPCCPIPLGPTQ
jgi:hypothetical protein